MATLNPLAGPASAPGGADAADAPVAAAIDAGAGAASSTTAAGDSAYRAKATQAAVQFEGFFIAQMLHTMRASTRQMAADDSAAKDPVNQDMLDLADTMVADKMAGQRAFGIADAILRQLLPATPAALPAAAANAATAAAASAAAKKS